MGVKIYAVINGKKICTGCHQSKLEDEYGFIKKKNGRHVQKAKCKECLKKATIYWRDNHREKYKETRRAYNERNQERIRAKSYVQHAGYRNLVCEISEDRFIDLFRQPCHYCGAHEGLNGVDRSDNDLGYVESNVLSCCGTCNIAKKKMNREQFLAWVKRIALHQGF